MPPTSPLGGKSTSKYIHVYGMAMGSPVSVVITNLVMEDVGEREVSSFAIP